MRKFFGQVYNQITEPYESWDSVYDATIAPVLYAFLGEESKTRWPYLLTSLVVAFFVWRHGRERGYFDRTKSFFQVAFPKAIYTHRSSIIDCKFVLLDQFLRGLLYAPVVTGISYYLYLVLEEWLGRSSFQLSPTLALWFLPLYAILIIDLGYYIEHRILHNWSFLWPFHEVHHSAEVLSPITVFRVHPVETLISALVHVILNAVSAAFFTSVTDIKVDPYQLLGINIVTFLYYTIGFQLRHSHLWLSYGPVVDRIFSSPAQHQIHHSAARKHWNKNFGLIFSFWDTLLGTGYLPTKREEITFGTGGNADPNDYASVAKLYLLPFVKSYRAVRYGRPVTPFPDETPSPAAVGAHERQAALSGDIGALSSSASMSFPPSRSSARD